LIKKSFKSSFSFKPTCARLNLEEDIVYIYNLTRFFNDTTYIIIAKRLRKFL